MGGKNCPTRARKKIQSMTYQSFVHCVIEILISQTLTLKPSLSTGIECAKLENIHLSIEAVEWI